MIFQPSDRPLEVTLLVLPESSLLSVASTLDPLRAANRVSGRELYRWRVVSPDGAAPRTTCGLALPAEGAFDPEAAVIRVEAGIRWREIQALAGDHGLAVKIMQTYSNFTVGGSLKL